LSLHEARQLGKFLTIEQGVVIVVKPRKERFEISHRRTTWTAPTCLAERTLPTTLKISCSAGTDTATLGARWRESATPARPITVRLGRDRFPKRHQCQHDRRENDGSHVSLLGDAANAASAC
jgi:hypothetical protein